MDALRAALSDLIAFLPDLIAGLVILLIGWGVARLVGMAVRRLLPKLGFDRFIARHRLTTHRPEEHTGSRAVATAAAWVIMLVALMQAAGVWGLEFVASGLATVIAYVPNVIAAVLIFAGAWIVARWVADRIRAGSEVRAENVILPGAVRAGILTIGAFVALRQLLIAPEILVIAFTLVFGAIAVATALAFGLGGRKAAERMTSDWYERQSARRRGYVEPTGRTGIGEEIGEEERPLH